MKKLLLPLCLLFLLSCENDYIEVKNPFKKDEIINLYLECAEKPSYPDKSLWKRNFSITINKTTNEGTLNDYMWGKYILIKTDEWSYTFKHPTKPDFIDDGVRFPYEYILNRISLDILEINAVRDWECIASQRI
mgnify:CR=1 FL=1|tara:strand:+ start:286 stop:687 length:402 start_codon:yes stop_codon:yes gene_type:complete